MNINNSRINSLCRKCLCRLKRKMYHKAGSNNGNVLAVAKLHTLANLKLVSLGDDRTSKSAKSQIERTVGLHSRLNRRFCFNCIRRIDDRHSGNSSHKSNILKTLMSRTVLANSNTRVSRADLYVKMRITDAVSHLLKRSACRKHRKGGGKSHLACRREACRNRDHISLRDSAIEESVGICLFKHHGFRCLCKIGIEHHVIIFVCKLNERLAVSFSCCHLICHYVNLRSVR